MSRNRYEQLIQWFYHLENKHKLFEIKINGEIEFWSLVRHDVLYQLLKEHQFYPDSFQGIQPKPSTPFLIRILKYLRLLPFLLVNEFKLLFLKHNKSVLLFLTDRTKTDKGYTDLLFQDIETYYGQKAFKMIFFCPDRMEVFKWINRDKYYITMLEFRKLKRNRFPQNVSNILPEDFVQELGLSEDLNVLIGNALADYKTEYRFYTRILSQVKPKALFFQSIPKSLISAANNMGIKTIDLQHGHIDRNDSFYGFHKNLDTKPISSIPDFYCTAGSYWNQFVHPTIQSITIGSTYFCPPQHTSLAQNILIIGSRFIHDAILNELKDCAQVLPNERFIYKLHSNQGDQMEATCAFFAESPNVEIRIFDDINTLLVSTKWLILVQSTVAYQALQMGIPVCIYKKYYYEASADLFERSDVILVDSLSEFPQHLSEGVPEQSISTTYFEPFQPDCLSSLIQ